MGDALRARPGLLLSRSVRGRSQGVTGGGDRIAGRGAGDGTATRSGSHRNGEIRGFGPDAPQFPQESSWRPGCTDGTPLAGTPDRGRKNPQGVASRNSDRRGQSVVVAGLAFDLLTGV